MKNLGKTKAIVISSIIAFITVVALLLSFVPMHLGSKDFESFAGALSKSNTINGGMSVTYEIKSDSTNKDIQTSINSLSSIISEYGFKSVTAYKKGDNKIKVNLNEPVLTSERSNTESFLKSLASGQMQFKNKNDASKKEADKETDATLIIIDISKHVESVEKISYNQSSGVKINFNKEGKALYASATHSPLYMFVNNTAWPNSNGNEVSANTDPNATSMYLMFNSAEVVDNYYYVIKSAMMPIALDSEEVEVSYNSNKTALTAMVSGIVLMVIVAVGLISLSVFKQKGFAIAPIVSSLIGLAILLFFMQAMNWVVVGLSTLIAIIMLTLLTYILNATIFSTITNEYSLGKSLATATDDAYRKNLWVIIDSLAVTFIIGLVMAILSTGELVGVGTILALGSVILALNTLLFNRLILNCLYTLCEQQVAFFAQPKREDN